MTQSLEKARIRTMSLHSLVLSRIAQDTETYKLLVSLWDAMERERKLAGRKADVKRIKMMCLNDGTFTNLTGCQIVSVPADWSNEQIEDARSEDSEDVIVLRTFTATEENDDRSG